MQFSLLLLFVGFIVFLFAVYVHFHDDFALFRKNIRLEAIFDSVFLSVIVGGLLARLLFVLSHPSSIYANPLVFLLVPYFPGLSLIGGVVGFGSAFYFFSKRDKLPFGTISDGFALAFLPSYLVVQFFSIALAFIKRHGNITIVMPLLFGLILYACLLWLHKKKNLPAGLVALVFGVVFATYELVNNLIIKPGQFVGLTIESFLSAIMMIFLVVVLLKKRELLEKLFS